MPSKAPGTGDSSWSGRHERGCDSEGRESLTQPVARRRKAAHPAGDTVSVGPAGFFESRAATRPGAWAISTHSELAVLKLLLRHAGSGMQGAVMARLSHGDTELSVPGGTDQLRGNVLVECESLQFVP